MNLFELLPEVILWGSIAYFWLLLVFVTIVSLICERHDNWFWLIGTILVFGFITQTRTNVDLRDVITLSNALGYLGIGFVYAMLMTYIYGRKSDSKYSPEYYDVKSKVIRWWFLFPLSIINWIVSDFIFDATEFIYDKFSGLFEYIFRLGYEHQMKKKKKNNGFKQIQIL